MRLNRERVGAVVRGDGSVSAALAVVSAYLLVTVSEVVLAGVLPIPVLPAVELTSALPVPIAAVMGSAVLWAIPVGYVLGDLLVGGAGTWTLVGAGVHLSLGYSAAKLIGRLRLDTTGSASRLLDRETAPRFVLAVGVAAVGAAAVGGWLSELVRTAPFFLAASSWLAELLVLSLVCTVPLVGAFRAVTRAVESRFDVTWQRALDPHESLRARRVALVSLAWLLVGTAGSAGYRTLERLPALLLRGRGLGALSALDRPELFGAGAARVQVLLGAVLAPVLLATYLAWFPAGTGDGDGTKRTEGRGP
jgi:hypothetical protein